MEKLHRSLMGKKARKDPSLKDQGLSREQLGLNAKGITRGPAREKPKK